MKKKEKYYNVQEAADILGVTTKSVWNWIKSGRLKAEKEFVKGNHWARNCYKLARSEVMKEKKAVPICLWCEKPIKSAKNRQVRMYCYHKHRYLHKKSIGYYDK